MRPQAHQSKIYTVFNYSLFASSVPKMNATSSYFPWHKATPLTTNPVVLVVLVPFLTLALSYLVSWITSPLRGFPGPALACQFKHSTLTEPTLKSMHEQLSQTYGVCDMHTMDPSTPLLTKCTKSTGPLFAWPPTISTSIMIRVLL